MPGFAKTTATGHYVATHDSTTMGIVERAHEWENQTSKVRITSDDYGQGTTLDNLYDGRQMFVQMFCLEWIAQPKEQENAYGTAGTLGSTGVQDTDHAKSLVMTAAANTPAATNHASRTCPLAIQDGSLRSHMGNLPRILPITFELLPNSAGTYYTEA